MPVMTQNASLAMVGTGHHSNGVGNSFKPPHHDVLRPGFVRIVSKHIESTSSLGHVKLTNDLISISSHLRSY